MAQEQDKTEYTRLFAMFVEVKGQEWYADGVEHEPSYMNIGICRRKVIMRRASLDTGSVAATKLGIGITVTGPLVHNIACGATMVR